MGPNAYGRVSGRDRLRYFQRERIAGRFAGGNDVSVGSYRRSCGRAEFMGRGHGGTGPQVRPADAELSFRSGSTAGLLVRHRMEIWRTEIYAARGSQTWHSVLGLGALRPEC